MKHTVLAVLIAAFSAAMIAQEMKAREVPFTKEQALEVENLSLKRALLDQQEVAFARTVCAAAGIAIERCRFNQNKSGLLEMPLPEVQPAKK